MKARNGLGIFGLCVVLTVSLGTTLQVAQANECCDFATGCASAPTGQLPSSVCTAQGGSYNANSKCNTTSGNCEANAGAPDARTCCLDATSGVCANATVDCGIFIPTVSQWGLAVMVLLVLTAGTIVVMRRRAVATT